MMQYGHQWPRKKLITSVPSARRSAEVMICPSWFGKAKAGTRAPTPSARSACPDRRSSSVARCMISIADRGTLKGGAPDSKLALKASSRSCSVMNPPRVIHGQLELRRLLHGKIGRFHALQNLVHVGGRAAVRIGKPVEHEATGVYVWLGSHGRSPGPVFWVPGPLATSCQHVDGGTAFSHSGGGPGEEGQPVRTSF